MFVLEPGRPIGHATAPNPEFGLVGEPAIRLPSRWHNRETVRYLAARVLRKPGDLLSHMRRIWLHHDLHDGAGTAAAAIDLFIATQDKGRDLRQRVLRTFARELSVCGCYEALRETVDGTLSRHDSRIALDQSLLYRPVSGGFDFVRRVADVRHTSANSADQAGPQCDTEVDW